jgi:hypothetical protein
METVEYYFKVLLLAGAALMLNLAGCAEEVHTVEWYKEHKAERDAQLKKCDDNPGQLNNTPNCINARESIELNRRGPMPKGW